MPEGVVTGMPKGRSRNPDSQDFFASPHRATPVHPSAPQMTTQTAMKRMDLRGWSVSSKTSPSNQSVPSTSYLHAYTLIEEASRDVVSCPAGQDR